MAHKSQTRKALPLFGLILTGLFCAAQGAAVFTQGPAIAKQGDSAVVITFTVSESTDVEVGTDALRKALCSMNKLSSINKIFTGGVSW